MKGNPISHDNVATLNSGRKKLDFTELCEIICFGVPWAHEKIVIKISVCIYVCPYHWLKNEMD